MKKFTLKTVVLTTALLLTFINNSIAQPYFEWAKGIGGGANADLGSLAVDASGNVYITGRFAGTVDFDPGTGTFNLTSAGQFDIFISKLDVNGNFVWAKSMGGTSVDMGYSIAVDASGNVYITGFFEGTAEFDPGANTFNLTSAGGYDIFVSKLDASGNFVWSKRMGGIYYDIARSIALDALGNVFTTGQFAGTADFDPGAGTYNLTSVGYDIFISKLDVDGNFIWAKTMAGTYVNDIDDGFSIAVDSSGNIYTTGRFQGTVDFDPGSGIYNLSTTGMQDIFISKLDVNGNFVWAKSMAGTATDLGASIAVDASGNVYTTGYFSGTVDFDPGPGAFNLVSAGGNDIFISKLDAYGNFIWAKRIGETYNDYGYALAVDANGNIYAAGHFSGTVDLDPGVGTFSITSIGNEDIYIIKLESNGNLMWANRIGGSGEDIPFSIFVDISGYIYTNGVFQDTVDFDPGPSTFNLTAAIGNNGLFISKLSQVDNTSILKQTNHFDSNFFPNPANGFITVESEQPAQLIIFNGIGEEIYKSVVLQTLSQHNLSMLSNGMYYLQLFNEKNTITEKLIIAR